MEDDEIKHKVETRRGEDDELVNYNKFDGSDYIVMAVCITLQTRNEKGGAPADLINDLATLTRQGKEGSSANKLRLRCISSLGLAWAGLFSLAYRFYRSRLGERAREGGAGLSIHACIYKDTMYNIYCKYLLPYP